MEKSVLTKEAWDQRFYEPYRLIAKQVSRYIQDNVQKGDLFTMQDKAYLIDRCISVYREKRVLPVTDGAILRKGRLFVEEERGSYLSSLPDFNYQEVLDRQLCRKLLGESNKSVVSEEEFYNNLKKHLSRHWEIDKALIKVGAETDFLSINDPKQIEIEMQQQEFFIKHAKWIEDTFIKNFTWPDGFSVKNRTQLIMNALILTYHFMSKEVRKDPEKYKRPPFESTHVSIMPAYIYEKEGVDITSKIAKENGFDFPSLLSKNLDKILAQKTKKINKRK